MSFLLDLFSDATAHIDPTHFKGLSSEMLQNFPSVTVDQLIENRSNNFPSLVSKAQDIIPSSPGILQNSQAPNVSSSVNYDNPGFNPIPQSLKAAGKSLERAAVKSLERAASKSIDPIKLAERAYDTLGKPLARISLSRRPSAQQIQDVAGIAEEVSRVPTNNPKGNAAAGLASKFSLVN